MNEMTQIIIWWVGALLCVAALGVTTWAMLVWLEEVVAKRVLHITRLVTVRYWVDRMEREGLTICMKDYRKMVAERNPQDLQQFLDVDRDWQERNRHE